ncbi:chloramphenicol acetyltransferase [Uliginosibacterium sp. 31-16]|uniref:chloramphenicol acetyltransferase n=1 Tax=Uliginosibacterium sp. 31-16 TaxID=3068315 RepID=UPI00273EAF14|nr:chloramphenicol acetyltransferase [Uliginosibacterium sp. 31-16]MDP5241103.1 chloramphenicol acetyltransferase [Uliginosibacterium sp. 31-16]
MKEIDLETWPRREHFNFFGRLDYPIYNVCFELDVTRLHAFAKRTGLSFTNTMLHVSTAAANRVDNLKYRIRGEKVVLHEVLHPSFTCMVEGSDLFKLVTVDFDADIARFDAQTKQAVQAQREYFPLDKLKGRDDFIFFSSLPWIAFTGLDHTVNLKRDDTIPRITWGKFQPRAGQLMLPYNIQVNHRVVDGFHLGLFRQALDEIMETLP